MNVSSCVILEGEDHDSKVRINVKVHLPEKAPAFEGQVERILRSFCALTDYAVSSEDETNHTPNPNDYVCANQ